MLARFSAALVLLSLASDATAQTARTLDVQVVQIAGSTFYISQGSEAGLGDDIRVWVGRTGVTRDSAQATVVTASADRSVFAFTEGPLALVRGDSLWIRWQATPAPDGRAAAERGEQKRQPTPALVPRSPTVHGRVSMELAALRSSTRAGGEEPDAANNRRDFVTPTTRLEARAVGLPAGLTARSQLRASYRYTAGDLVPQTTSIRIYELAMEKRFQRIPVQVVVGRFHNPYEHFSAYWDGAMARWGDEGFGVGGAAGFQPSTWNEGVEARRPKVSAFVNFRSSGSLGRTRGAVSVQHVAARDGGLDRTYFGWAQAYARGPWRTSGSVQVDRNPSTGGWTVSDMLASGSFAVSPRLRLRSRWSHRRPFYYWRQTAVVGYRRDDVGAGLTWTWTGGSWSADVTGHDAENTDGWSPTVSSAVRVYPAGPLRVGFTASATHGSSSRVDISTLAGAFDGTLGRVDARLGYRLYATASSFFESTTHEVTTSLGATLHRETRGLLLFSTRFGSGLEANRVHLVVSRSF